ncbi:MAG TPA: M28 family peptidase, partial [Pyrinomonadaceae bacterium]
MRKFRVLFFGLILSFAVAAQTTPLSTEDDIKNDVALAPCKNSDRLAAVEKLFRDKGATDADIKIVEAKKTKNLIVTKKGTGDGTIIVGAHYDKVATGCGAIDNWTGVVNIAHLYHTIKSSVTTKTFEFIAFDREEEGLIGSSVFVSQIPKEDRKSVCEMVNLDSFGFSSTQVLVNASSPKLIAGATAF